MGIGKNHALTIDNHVGNTRILAFSDGLFQIGPGGLNIGAEVDTSQKTDE